jgi:hypothetical protein
MKAIVSRLRRLENAAAPYERERANVEAILENMAESYEGCRTCADFMLREWALLEQYEAQHAEAQGQSK